MIIYLEKGWIDATNEEDCYQCIGVDTETFKVVDDEELIFEYDLPDDQWLSYSYNWEEALEKYKMKGWREQ